MSFIKKRNFDLDKIPEEDIIVKIGDYYLFKSEENKVLLGGVNLIDLNLLQPILFTYQLKFYNKLSQTDREFFNESFNYDLIKDDEIFSIGFITLNSLRKFKLTENLNILTLYFNNKEEAFILLDILERFKFKKFKLDLDGLDELDELNELDEGVKDESNKSIGSK